MIRPPTSKATRREPTAEESSAGSLAPRVVQERLSEALRAAAPLRLAVLFGSTARDELHFQSDTDIAVAGDRRLEAAELLRIVDSVALCSGRPVDVVDLRRAGSVLLHQVLARGRILFCDDASILTGLRQRMLLEAEDFAPLRRRILDERRRARIGT